MKTKVSPSNFRLTITYYSLNVIWSNRLQHKKKIDTYVSYNESVLKL